MPETELRKVLLPVTDLDRGEVADEEVEVIARLVEAACAEMGVTLVRHETVFGCDVEWWPVTVEERAVFEKAKRLAAERFGLTARTNEREVIIRG